MARIALIDPSGRSTTTVQAVLGRSHEVFVRSRIHAPGDCDLVIADLPHADLADTSILRSLGSFGPVLLLVDKLQPIPVAVHESDDLSVLRKPFDAFELRLAVDRLLRAAAFPAPKSVVPRLEEEDAQWLEFPFVPAPAGAVLRRAAKLAAPLWILGEPGSGRRRVAMAVCRSVDPPLRVVTLFPDEMLSAVLERESASEPYALLVPEIEKRPLLEQERLALLIGGKVGFRLIATSVDDPGEKVLAGEFSRSLYQQLCGLAVQLSPLRERPVTIPPLVQALVRRLGRRLGLGEDISFSPAAMARLQTYMWPGNVFELEAVLNRTLVHVADKDVAARGIDADEILFMPDDATQPRPGAKPGAIGVLARLPERTERQNAAPSSVDVQQVIAGLAHDLRNPMTTIRTFASTLEAVRPADGAARRLGDLAGEACTRIDGYLETLQRYVDFAAPSPRSCDLVELARRALGGGDAEAGPGAFGAKASEPVRVECDPLQLEFVFENIAAALRAQGDPDASLTLRAQDGAVALEAPRGRGAATKLRELVAEGSTGVLTWRLLLARAVAEKNGFVVEEDPGGDVLRIRCRPAGGEVESRNEQANRTDR